MSGLVWALLAVVLVIAIVVLLRSLCGGEVPTGDTGKEPQIMREIVRMHALTNTASGTAAELRVAAELARCGIRVADPYWGDDEVDLLILWMAVESLVPIPVQVKAVQFGVETNQPPPATRAIQGLKKRYVERQPALCLAMYRLDTDDIWFIHGAARIRQVYDAQYNASMARAGAGRRKINYADIEDGSDIRIDLTRVADAEFDRQWKVDKRNAMWLSQRIGGLSNELTLAGLNVQAILEAMWTPPNEDDEGPGDDDGAMEVIDLGTDPQ
jgi:hypothetical protein